MVTVVLTRRTGCFEESTMERLTSLPTVTPRLVVRHGHSGGGTETLCPLSRQLIGGVVDIVDADRGRLRSRQQAAISVLAIPGEGVTLVGSVAQRLGDKLPGDLDLQLDAL